MDDIWGRGIKAINKFADQSKSSVQLAIDLLIFSIALACGIPIYYTHSELDAITLLKYGTNPLELLGRLASRRFPVRQNNWFWWISNFIQYEEKLDTEISLWKKQWLDILYIKNDQMIVKPQNMALKP